MSLAPNTPLGPYIVLAPLGAGGMGEVYRARDTRLDREVAIKVLPEQLARDPVALARFEREAKAVAALSHPNILAIYNVGSHHDTSYVVTELLKGETLRQRLSHGPIPWRKAVEIADAIAEGLSAGHAKGIIHRDIKPENIFLTTDRAVKILDFGLARLEEPFAPPEQRDASTLTLETRPGTMLGTLNYMSPEQVRGLRVDARSDTFSLGCVLCEMILGRCPFARPTHADTVTAILKEDPPNLAKNAKDVPAELERVIRHCLEKEPRDRFQSAGDLAYDLRNILSDSIASRASTRQPRPRRRALAVAAAATAAMAIVVSVGLWLLGQPGKGTSSGAVRPVITALAVLPLENLSRDPEQEYFSDGMTEALISDLAKISALRVISRTSVMQYKGAKKPLPQIARELNVDAVVEGSVLCVGDRVRISAQLIHAATDRHLWAQSYERDLRNILALQSDIARAVAQEIKVNLQPKDRDRLTSTRQIDPRAHQAYLKGRYLWNKRTREAKGKAIEFFNEAIEIDPSYALAYAGLADAYHVYGALPDRETGPKAKAAAMKALEIDDTLGEPYATLGSIAYSSDYDWSAAEEYFKRAIALTPNYATAHQWYALYLSFTQRFDEALAEINRAQECDPLSPVIQYGVGVVFFCMQQYDKMIEKCRNALQIWPDFVGFHELLGDALVEKGLFEEGIAAYLKAKAMEPMRPATVVYLVRAYTLAGRTEEARKMLDELKEQSKHQFVSAMTFAEAYTALGEHDRAFEFLDKAYEERSPTLVQLGVHPIFDALRADPRFHDLLRRIGLPAQPAASGARSSVKRPEEKIMLAVLPFENLSRDPEQDYFSDGLTEEMISQLSRLNPRKLGVIARTSAMHYKNTAKTIDAIGRELGVAYIVEGSVRRAGDRVRITAQLIQVNDQTHLWAQNYERDLKDVFALQIDVAERIAGSLAVELLPGAVSISARARPINPAAHEAYLKGRFYWNKRTSDGLQKAVEHFEQAVALEPGWPLGYAGLADAYVVMPYSSVRPSEAIPKARAAAAKALQMDESLGEAHATLGIIATFYDWDWPTAEREFQRVLALSPNYATAHQWYALHLMFTGRHDEAIREITKAQELDPLSLVIGVTVGMVHYYAGDFEQSETRLRKTLELDADFAYAHLMLAETLFLQRKFAEAITEAREAVRLSNNEPSYATLGHVCAKAGQPDEAREILDQLAARSTDAYVPPSHFAWVHAGLDERDRMFEWLERAYKERDVLLLYILTDPLLAPMRSDPRFADLLRRVGLPAKEE